MFLFVFTRYSRAFGRLITFLLQVLHPSILDFLKFPFFLLFSPNSSVFFFYKFSVFYEIFLMDNMLFRDFFLYAFNVFLTWLGVLTS